jgi:hypothetical protein
LETDHIRVDLPGITAGDKIADNDDVPANKSWYRTKFFRNQAQRQIKCVIEGFRCRGLHDEIDQDHFGNFRLTFDVDPYFDGERIETFENSVLSILSCLRPIN